MTCRHCDRPLRPAAVRSADRPGTVAHRGRGLCRPCWNAHRDDYDLIARSGPDILADVDALDGIPEREVAARLGITVAAITKAAERHNRPDIAARFRRLAWTARRTA